jgi:hypothetical protein
MDQPGVLIETKCRNDSPSASESLINSAVGQNNTIQPSLDSGIVDGFGIFIMMTGGVPERIIDNEQFIEFHQRQALSLGLQK